MLARLAPVAFGFVIAVSMIVGYNWYPVTPVAAPKTARVQQVALQTVFAPARFGN